jgi:hypothetical protein
VNTELELVKRDFDFAKTRFEENIMSKKSYNHILSRLKVRFISHTQHDLICFQLKQNQLDSVLKK